MKIRLQVQGTGNIGRTPPYETELIEIERRGADMVDEQHLAVFRDGTELLRLRLTRMRLIVEGCREYADDIEFRPAAF